MESNKAYLVDAMKVKDVGVIDQDDVSDNQEVSAEFVADKHSFVSDGFTESLSRLFDVKGGGNPSSSAMLRSHRTKLSTDDIKLILFLINRIKPFKYVGDNNLSQTKKWELIQKEFANIKKSNNSPDLIIPTVRTLQRQLAAAIKKATIKRNQNIKNGIIDSNPEKFLSTITIDSSLEDLELSLLELNDVSEKLKNSKVTSSMNYRNGVDFQYNSPVISTEFRNSNSSSAQNLNSNQDPQLTLSISISSIINTSSNTKVIIEKIHQVKQELNQQLSTTPSSHYEKSLKLIDSLQTLLDQSIEFQSSISLENFKILDETQKLIKRQQIYTEKLLQFNNDLQTKQNQLNKEIMNNVLDHIIILENDYKSESGSSIEKSLLSLKDSIN
jgi:hypothetical protein